MSPQELSDNIEDDVKKQAMTLAEQITTCHRGYTWSNVTDHNQTYQQCLMCIDNNI